jgi:PAS domain S-box-containing protein
VIQVHRLLQRQMARAGVDQAAVPEGGSWRRLLERVSQTYVESDQDRYTLERSVELSSAEMQRLHDSLADERDRLRQMFKCAPLPMLLLDQELRVIACNEPAERLLKRQSASVIGTPFGDLLVPLGRDAILHRLRDLTSDGHVDQEVDVVADGAPVAARLAASISVGRGADQALTVVTLEDLSERKQLEVELRHSQKLESIGRLASGIAHEINTPIQFIGDNAQFLVMAFANLQTLVEAYKRARDSGAACDWDVVTDRENEADLGFLCDEVPAALAAMQDGVERVATIVRAMRAFAHPDGGGFTSADLNLAIQHTLTVARSEIKTVADVRLDLTPLPDVTCCLSDLNQVFLNLFVNAAHAISDAGRAGHGVITVRSSIDEDHVVIAVGDNGTGIADHVRERVFEPFFTTKEVGRGTGQGLALASAVVKEKHGGALTFDTTVGVGTTFFVRLPIRPPHENDL